MNRGVYTEELKTKYGINDVDELNLIPYVHYCLINQQPIDSNNTHPKERVILSNWQSKGYLTYSMYEPLTVSKEFWDIMNNVLYDAYVLPLNNKS